MKKNIAKSILFGVSVGDALGVPVEFSSRESLKKNPVTNMRGFGTYNQPAGTWSDDSSLCFCLAESIAEDYSLRKCADKFVKWRNEAYWTPHNEVFDIGITTNYAINRLFKILRFEKFEELEKLGHYGNENENGNGSLMRCLPLIYIIWQENINRQFSIVWQNSALTHRHIRSAMACLIYLKIAEFIIRGYSKQNAYEKMQLCIKNLWDQLEYDSMERIQFEDIVTSDISQKSESEIFSDGYVVHSLEASIWCFMNTETYEECVLKAVNLGADTDTTAAIAGGLAGLYYGYENIPKDWINKIKRKQDIANLAEKLTMKFGDLE